MADMIPAADTAASTDFMERLFPGERWDLAAISPDRRDPPEFRIFMPDDRSAASDWIDDRQGKKGLYYHVNLLRAAARNIKATKSDIEAIRCLHVDVDINDEPTLAALKSFVPPPSVVVFSGGGYQALWRLKELSTEFDRVEHINQWIARQLGGDNCHNIDRLLRLPGTINLPNAKKRAAGRKPVLARVVS